MKRLLALSLSLRGLLMIAIVGAACWASSTYSMHHTGDNVFTTLYMHLVPSALVQPSALTHVEQGHGEASAEPAHALLEIPLPKALALFDYRGDVHSAEPKTA